VILGRGVSMNGKSVESARQRRSMAHILCADAVLGKLGCSIRPERITDDHNLVSQHMCRNGKRG
ncbi:MAG: hypothetical protein KF909_16095, partial [Rhodocyclaceae bacterium]|nr:hypothetical protein [Rhodocyclaceae bacterium]